MRKKIYEKETLYKKFNTFLCFIYYIISLHKYILDLVYFFIGFIILTFPSLIVFKKLLVKIENLSYLINAYKYIIFILILFIFFYLFVNFYMICLDNISEHEFHSSKRFAFANKINLLIYLILIYRILYHINIKSKFSLNDYFSLFKIPLLILSFYIIIKNCFLEIKDSTAFTLIYIIILISYFKIYFPKKIIIEIIIFFYICHNFSLSYKMFSKGKYIPLILHIFLILNCFQLYYIMFKKEFTENELIINLFIFLFLNSYFFGKYFFNLFFKPIKQMYFVYPHIEKPYYKRIKDYHGYEPNKFPNIYNQNIFDSNFDDELVMFLSKENQQEPTL